MQDGCFPFSGALERSCFHYLFPWPETDREMSGPEKNENLMEIFPIIPLKIMVLCESSISASSRYDVTDLFLVFRNHYFR